MERAGTEMKQLIETLTFCPFADRNRRFPRLHLCEIKVTRKNSFFFVHPCRLGTNGMPSNDVSAWIAVVSCSMLLVVTIGSMGPMNYFHEAVVNRTAAACDANG